MQIAHTHGGKTARQWAKDGYLVKPGEQGTTCWTNKNCGRTAVYYTADQVRRAEPKEIADFFMPERDARNAAARKRAAKKHAADRVKKLLNQAAALSAVPCENPSKMIVVDVETTGLQPGTDEILQISIIDGSANVLINTYVKPYAVQFWQEAYRVNKISPAMVENAPQAHEIIPILKGIFESADVVVGYNLPFDLAFLDGLGISANCDQVDVMIGFAEIYGEWDNHHGNYKWKSLETAASYYGYHFSAHNSLEDVKATLYVLQCMISDRQ